MNPSPEICPQCQYRFPTRAPEPSWCPQCGRLCSASDQPEVPAEGKTEFGAAALGTIFWVLFFGTPVMAGVAAVIPQKWTYSVAAKLGLPILISPAALPITALCCGALASGWILGRLTGHTFLERAIMTMLGTTVVLTTNICVVQIGHAVLSFWMK